MVSEMAPVDLLLQRAGRMHRHKRNNRPKKLDRPTLWICKPESNSDIPSFGNGTEAVYDAHILLRSWLAIKDKNEIIIPDEIEELIEKVYDENFRCPESEPAEIKDKWDITTDKLRKEKNKYEGLAKINRILPPYYEDEILEDFNRELEEDNPSVNKSIQALTRISDVQSISIVCLYGDINNPYLDIDSHEVLNTQMSVDKMVVKKLLNKSVNLANNIIVPIIVKSDVFIPTEWRKEPLLRHHYMLFFDENGNCKTEFSKYRLSLNNELGVVILKKKDM
jgi:CRISPR-associated endonuclease/helicase Cas3